MLLLLKVVLTLLVLGHLWTASCRNGKEDEAEIEKQLEILNKPSIKTFKTTEGETIDCVNIYAQPALDHPLLKNHKIQLSPTFLSSLPKNSQNVKSALHILREPCPNGTVPIVRVDKKMLIRVRSLPKEPSLSSVRINLVQPRASHPMFLRIQPKYFQMYGGGGRASVYNLTVKEDQVSSVQLWIESGPTGLKSMILAGWRVSPQLNGDGLTRLFTYWHRNEKVEGCYNTLCPGFVQVDKVVPPNLPLIKTSIPGKPSMEIRFQVKQDRESGNWWFIVFTSREIFHIGYWPKELFDHLADGCDIVSFGGVGRAGSDKSFLPPVGSGNFPRGDYRDACYFADLHYIDSKDQKAFPPMKSKSIHTHFDLCYGFKYFGDVSWPLHAPYHQNIQLGGPGGYCIL